MFLQGRGSEEGSRFPNKWILLGWPGSFLICTFPHRPGLADWGRFPGIPRLMCIHERVWPVHPQQANATCSEQPYSAAPGIYFFQQPGVQAWIPPLNPENYYCLFGSLFKLMEILQAVSVAAGAFMLPFKLTSCWTRRCLSLWVPHRLQCQLVVSYHRKCQGPGGHSSIPDPFYLSPSVSRNKRPPHSFQ